MSPKELIDYQRTVLRLKLEKFLLYNLWMDYCPEVKEKVYIYGAGIVGKLLFRCFETKPVAFLDAKENINTICGLPVWCVKNITAEQFGENDTVIVTPVWDYEEIKKNLSQISEKLNVVSLEKLVERL